MAVLLWTDTVHHDGSPLYVHGDTSQLGSKVTLRLRIAADSPVDRVMIRTCPDGEQAMLPMHPAEVNGPVRWWEGELELSMRLTSYRFLLHTPRGSWWYTANGIGQSTPIDIFDFKILADFHSPSWITDTVFYQIFPERFANGDPFGTVQNAEYIYSGKQVVAKQWNDPIEQGAHIFYGGDVPGIIDHLDYLQDLGVTALYLTPIFTSPSNHKYDAADYRHVDPHFGGDEALVQLRQELDRRAMRLMLDIVPNHCGNTHPWFTAAQQDSNAPQAEYFTFYRWPDDYACWLGVKSLPKLDYRSEGLRHEMYESHDAIMRTWLREPYRIDAWRMDVANMLGRQGETQLGHKVGRGIRRAMKETAPEMYLLGENFFDASPHLQGNELDAAMNYRGFIMPLQRWLASFDLESKDADHWAEYNTIPTAALAEQLRLFASAIPWQILIQQFNLIDSHDIPRMFSVVHEDLAKMQVAIMLLFTFPGVPCVYYGDEVGMLGGRDPDNRRCMNWDPQSWNMELYALYRTLIHVRRTSSALKTGGYQVLHDQKHTLAFLRESPDERIIVVARREDDGLRALPVQHGGICDGTILRELLTGMERTVVNGQLPLDSMPPVGAQVWSVAAPSSVSNAAQTSLS